jgi:alpha-mannosidase
MQKSRPLIVHMIGNAHIDPVWLWPWQAGVDEALATFRSAADRCDEYPEFIFTRGESWTYEWVEKLDPVLFQRVRRLVEKGQWHITGGQFLQPDCNLPTATGFRRCIEHGQRYFKDKFGVSPVVGYNVDSFGHAASLPDIYASMGYIGYCFQRPRPEQMAFPRNTFVWEGRQGGSIIGMRIVPLYVTRTDDLWGQITLAIENADKSLGHVMCFYGVGNHGGGPTKANIEYIINNRDSFPGARLEFSTPERFVRAVRHAKLPVMRGELQHCFPGCYSVMHDIKQRQFRGERLLENAERTLRLATGPAREDGVEKLDCAWRDLLFTQFHDILAGTASASTWEAARAMQGRALLAAEEVILENTRRWALQNLVSENKQRHVIINTSGTDFDGYIEAEPFIDFDRWGSRVILDEQGRHIPFQLIQPDGNIRTLYRVLMPLKVSADGHRALVVAGGAGKNAPDAQTDAIRKSKTPTANARLISNGKVSARLSPKGAFTWPVSPAAPAGRCELRLRRDETDTWTMHTDRFDDAWEGRFEGTGWVVEEQGPLRVSVRNTGVIGRSPCVLRISAAAGETVLRLAVEITWCEAHRILCLRQELPAASAQWVAAIAGGTVERPAGPEEGHVQGWAAACLPHGGALAMISPDASSASMRGRALEWTLLRSPEMAASGARPQVHHGRAKTADQGAHYFEFTLARTRRLDSALYDRLLNQAMSPCVLFDYYLGMNRPPWGDAPPRTLWLAAEARAREAGRMTHLVDDGGPGNIDDGRRPPTTGPAKR